MAEYRQEIEGRLAAYPTNLGRAQRAALQAQQARSASRGDRRVLAVADQAWTIAERAVAKVELQRKLDLERLASLERFRDARSMPHLAASGQGRESVLPPARPVQTGPIMTMGEVQLKTPSGWVLMDPNRGLGEDEEIRTGADGYAELAFPEARITLHPDTRFVQRSPSTYELIQGHVDATYKRWKKNVDKRGFMDATFTGPRYIAPARCVRSGTCTWSIRGTAFEIRCHKDSTTQLVLTEGEIEMETLGRTTPLTLRGGQTVLVHPSGDVVGPEPASMAEERWKAVEARPGAVA